MRLKGEQFPEAVLLQKIIRSRRSIRHFHLKDIPQSYLKRILEAGRWAPSGLNNQPWKFVLIRDALIKKNLSTTTIDRRIIQEAPALIAICLDKDRIYDGRKDLMASGACIQNMLLQITALGLGGCWLGEILRKREQAERIISLPKNLELVAILALGYPRKRKPKGSRRPLKKLLLIR